MWDVEINVIIIDKQHNFDQYRDCIRTPYVDDSLRKKFPTALIDAYLLCTSKKKKHQALSSLYLFNEKCSRKKEMKKQQKN